MPNAIQLARHRNDVAWLTAALERAQDRLHKATSAPIPDVIRAAAAARQVRRLATALRQAQTLPLFSDL